MMAIRNGTGMKAAASIASPSLYGAGSGHAVGCLTGRPCLRGSQASLAPALRFPLFSLPMRISILLFLGLILSALPIRAATVTGSVSDASGATVSGARVVLRGVATGQEWFAETGADGRFQFDAPSAGAYLLIFTRTGFSEAARTVIVNSPEETLDVSIQLELGKITTEVSVTAARAERENRQIPLHVDSISSAAVEQSNPVSTGDALSVTANITPVGNGPFGVRPRLRGLDSTRLLVLVDGERLNTARQATDRTGAEVGLISPDVVSRMEVVNGAGTTLYGSDALAGTINIITNEPTFSESTQWLYGFNGFLSSNEKGARGTATVGVTRTVMRCVCRPAWSRSTTTRPAISRSKTRGPSLPTERSTGPTRSMTTSASPLTRSPIPSMRPTFAPIGKF